MEDAAFGKLLPVFDKILMTGGEDRLLQIVLGVAKDTSLTPEQAILVARMFSRQRSQKLVYQQVSDLENGLLPMVCCQWSVASLFCCLTRFAAHAERLSDV
jgi:hypothetical protein